MVEREGIAAILTPIKHGRNMPHTIPGDSKIRVLYTQGRMRRGIDLYALISIGL